MDTLQTYSWPGNVRELENVIERAMIRSTGDTLVLDNSFGPVTRASARAHADSLDTVVRRHIEEFCVDAAGESAEKGTQRTI